MSNQDETHMRMAIELAKSGEGFVEPNPMVGCVLVRDDVVIGRGVHQKFGGPHAEVNALASLDNAAGSTAYVTLEPCSHVGKTGPCSRALIEAKIARVVIACQDPNPSVNGNGIKHLKENGIDVTVGVLEGEAQTLLAPFAKLITTQKPWIIGKWAMTLDGKIATSTGDSKWISNEQSREIVHQIRGRVDGVMVGIGTVLADDPMLNARPSDPSDSKRIPLRIVVDSNARTPIQSKLIQTSNQFPTLIAVGPSASANRCKSLKENGCHIFQSTEKDRAKRLNELLLHLGQKDSGQTATSAPLTNILVEGGGQLLGSLNDQSLLDEVHCFIGPSVLGGSESKSPMAGAGHLLMSESTSVAIQSVTQLGDDVYIVGRTKR
ncbi:MAG: bifunctional diaminohydroxyphosphoribosylaminopyrimidine deaminase/5-amino-6-(5-phosphoribosylamino)uracil reductase RibD [Mariniblastus sp.]